MAQIPRQSNCIREMTKIPLSKKKEHVCTRGENSGRIPSVSIRLAAGASTVSLEIQNHGRALFHLKFKITGGISLVRLKGAGISIHCSLSSWSGYLQTNFSQFRTLDDSSFLRSECFSATTLWFKRVSSREVWRRSNHWPSANFFLLLKMTAESSGTWIWSSLCNKKLKQGNPSMEHRIQQVSSACFFSVIVNLVDSRPIHW